MRYVSQPLKKGYLIMKISIPEHIEAMKVIIKAVEYKSLIRTDYKELMIHLSIDNTLVNIRKIRN